jgi:hypothetical protein
MKKHLTATLLGAALLLAGCATAEMDWSHQVGELTFDQATGYLGAPDRMEKQPDGRLVAEWISRAAPAPADNDDDFHYHAASANLLPPARTAQASTLRLTFGTNNVLASWLKE